MRFSPQALVAVSLYFVAGRAAIVPAVAPSLHPHPSATGVEPKGRNVTINGVLTYVSLPKKKKYDESIALLLLTGEQTTHDFQY